MAYAILPALMLCMYICYIQPEYYIVEQKYKLFDFMHSYCYKQIYKCFHIFCIFATV